jgi:DNA-binding transcriptional ArsR family regulator
MAASKAAGKTWVLLQIAAAVATGGQAFSRLRCESTRVLFIELELSERRLCERFGKMRLADLPGLDIATAWRIGTEGLADLEAAVKDRGYGLVVVDVLARLWPRGADMNDYSTVYSLLGPLRDMANCLGVCIILVTHTRKTEAEDAIDQVMGSVGIVGTADVILALKRSRGSDDAVLRVDGNDFESQEIVLQFRTDPMGFEAVDIDPRETRLTPERKEVLEALREFEEGTAKEIAAVIGKDPDVVSKQLRALASDGMAVVVRFGVYKASRSGRSGRSDPKELPREYLSSSGRSKSETPTVPTTPTTKYESEFKSLPDAAFSETGTLWI